MFAVRDKRSNKFLSYFSGSFPQFQFNVWCELARQKYGETEFQKKSYKDMTVDDNEIDAYMFCLDTAEGAKLYKTVGGAKASLGGRKTLLSEKMPWAEIVPVGVSTNVNEIDKKILEAANLGIAFSDEQIKLLKRN